MKTIFKVFFLSLTLCAISFPAVAQKKLKLSNITNGEVIVIAERVRIACFSKAFRTVKGKLSNVTDSTIQVDGNTIPLNAIKSIGKRDFGTGARVVILALLADALINYFEFSEDDPAVRIGGGLAGVGLFGFAFHASRRNRQKNVTREWKLEVIN